MMTGGVAKNKGITMPLKKSSAQSCISAMRHSFAVRWERRCLRMRSVRRGNR